VPGPINSCVFLKFNNESYCGMPLPRVIENCAMTQKQRRPPCPGCTVRKKVTSMYRHAMLAYLPFAVTVGYNGGVSTILRIG
jgi:hypothetical protein